MHGEKRETADTQSMIEQILRAGRVSSGDDLQLENRDSDLKPGPRCRVGPISAGQAAGASSPDGGGAGACGPQQGGDPRDGKGRTGLCLCLGWICQGSSEGSLSQITPCCFLLGASLLFY